MKSTRPRSSGVSIWSSRSPLKRLLSSTLRYGRSTLPPRYAGQTSVQASALCHERRVCIQSIGSRFARGRLTFSFKYGCDLARNSEVSSQLATLHKKCDLSITPNHPPHVSPADGRGILARMPTDFMTTQTSAWFSCRALALSSAVFVPGHLAFVCEASFNCCRFSGSRNDPVLYTMEIK